MRRRGNLLVLSCAAVLMLSACTGGSAGSAATATPAVQATGAEIVPATVPAGASTPAASGATAGAQAGGPAAVTVVDYQFQPAQLQVTAGTQVTWTNKGKEFHTVTSDTSLFDSGVINSGESWSYKFDRPGTYPYYCTFHGKPGGKDMAGVIVVVAAP